MEDNKVSGRLVRTGVLKKISIYVLGCLVAACQFKSAPVVFNKALTTDPGLLHHSAFVLTDVIISDIFKPPVASRIYTYAYLAAYETLINDYPTYGSLAGKLNGFDAAPSPAPGQEYCFPLASLQAFVEVGKELTFSVEQWEALEKDLHGKYKAMGVPDEVFDRSLRYGEQVAKHVTVYAGHDLYSRTRNLKHSITNEPGTWVPTPPAYAEACEPQWHKMRSFTLDSAAQFLPPAPAPYDLAEDSPFYKMTREVYEAGKTLTDEQREIAYFWDDNAFVTNVKGHVTFASKKMTPAGHWLAIVSTVSKNQNIDLMRSLEAYTVTSIALYDAFVGSWQEKFRSVRVRPETVINQHLDPDWAPFLETPPFPEYVSGHSAISAAAGQVMTHLFGEKVAFVDSTEYVFGHGVRSFSSFEEAYWEASISRVYGGIHFWDGVEEGTRQGERIGQWVLQKVYGVEPKVIARAEGSPIGD
jgi:hypothetical protein